jgi:nucleoside-diphosphate-sugar epimerase
VHVYDIVAGIRKAMECPDLPAHGVYTLSGPDMRIADLTMEFLWKYRPDLAETVDPPLAGREPLLSIRKARQTFGYPPKYRLMD